MRLRLVTPLQWCGVLLAAAGLLTATNVGAQQACPAAQITITQPTGGVASYPWTFGYSDTAAYGGTYTGDLVTNKVEPGNLETRYVYEPVTAGRPNSSDWDGRIARIEWADDGLEAGGTTTRVIQRVGNKLTYPGGASATYTYDDHDLAEVRNDQTGESVAYEYDHLHNVTSVRTAKEAGGTRLMQIAYTYAADGRTITAARATNLGGEVTEATYDLYQLPLVIRRKAVVGSGYADLVTQFTYSRLAGNVPLNLTAVTQGDGVSNNLTTTFEYEPGHPQPTKVTDSTGAAWTTTYDTNTGLARFESSPTNSVGRTPPRARRSRCTTPTTP